MTTIQERLREQAGYLLGKLNVTAPMMYEAADKIDALQSKLDQYRTEYFDAIRERDEYRLAADTQAAAHKVERDAHLNNLRNAVTILQSVVNGGTSDLLAQASVNAFNDYIDAAMAQGGEK